MVNLTETYKAYRKVVRIIENFLMWKFPEYDCIVREHDKDTFEIVFMVRHNENRCDHTFFVTLDQLNDIEKISDKVFLPILV